jgi:hypothetical protein
MISCRKSSILSFVVIVAALASVSPAFAAEISLADNFRYAWDATSISLNGHVLYRATTKKEYESEGEGCSGDEAIEVLSLVGSIASLAVRGSSHCKGAAYVNHWNEVRVYQLTDGRVKRVHLFDVFPAADVIEALANDRWVKHTYDGDIAAQLKTIFETRSSVRDCQEINYRALYSFSFHHVKNGHVAVRIHLPRCLHDASTTILGIYLKIPENLRRDLANAVDKGVLEGALSRQR